MMARGHAAGARLAAEAEWAADEQEQSAWGPAWQGGAEEELESVQAQAGSDWSPAEWEAWQALEENHAHEEKEWQGGEVNVVL